MSELMMSVGGVGVFAGVVTALKRWPGRPQLYRRIGAWWIIRARGIEAREAAIAAEGLDIERACGVVREGGQR